MSCDVFVSVVRKEDYCPVGQFYLGGNGTRNSMFDVAMTEIEPGYAVMSFANAHHAINFLAQHEDEFYADNNMAGLNEYLHDQNPDKFAYWLVMEY